jgi:hypothetical protein
MLETAINGHPMGLGNFASRPERSLRHTDDRAGTPLAARRTSPIGQGATKTSKSAAESRESATRRGGVNGATAGRRRCAATSAPPLRTPAREHRRLRIASRCSLALSRAKDPLAARAPAETAAPTGYATANRSTMRRRAMRPASSDQPAPHPTPEFRHSREQRSASMRGADHQAET